MHYATRRFWQCYNALPKNVQRTADECYELLKVDPSHPSLHFKKLGKKYWSVRAGLSYRAELWVLKWKTVFLGSGWGRTQSMTN